jgi:hypothetical protein
MHRHRFFRGLIIVTSLIAIGSTAACSSPGHSRAGLNAVTPSVTTGPQDQTATPVPPSTAPATTTPATDPGTTDPTSTAHASATVTALSATYRGLCAPPSDATTFQAVIRVSGVTAGHPVTVHWHWRTSNGGDSDPSMQSHTFTTSGSFTTTHHESSYPEPPYPTVLNDWAAVVVSGAGPTITSGHAAYTVNCLPWVAVLSGTSTTYTGGCPPPLSALTFSVQISVSYPMAITFHWQTSNGGDSDPTPHTMNVAPGAPLVVTHSETSYTPGATTNDYVEVAVAGAGTTDNSNRVDYTETCS